MNALKFMALLLFSLGLALAVTTAADEFGDSYAPTPMPLVIAEPPQKGNLPLAGDYIKDKELVKCVDKITSPCGDAIFFYVYMGENYPSLHCCEKLVDTGRQCHKLMIERIAKAVPEYHERIVADPRNEKLWTYCLTKTAASSPSYYVKGAYT